MDVPLGNQDRQCQLTGRAPRAANGDASSSDSVLVLSSNSNGSGSRRLVVVEIKHFAKPLKTLDVSFITAVNKIDRSLATPSITLLKAAA